MTRFRVLVIKLAAIGDVVMALPLLQALRKKYPSAQISWICGSQVAPLLRATELIDEVIEVDEKKLLAGAFFTKMFSILKIWRRIGGRFFDLAMTLHADPRYRLIVWPIFCSDKRAWNVIPGRYHAQECLRLFDREEGASSRAIEFPLLSLPACPSMPKDKPVIVLAPGGAKNTLADDALRRWPVHRYAEVARELVQEAYVVVVGSASDRWVIPYFKDLPIRNLIGTLELLDLLALLKESALLVTHDSGPLHLAKLAKCSTLALFGPTNPNEKVSAQEKIKVLWGGDHLSCRPCYHGKYYANCRNNACLQSISSEQVVEEVRNLLLKNNSVDHRIAYGKNNCSQLRS